MTNKKNVDDVSRKSELDLYLGNLRAEDLDVREAAASALGKIGDKAAVPRLIEVFGDGNEYMDVRRAAAYALGGIGDKAAVPRLIEVFGDGNEYMDVRRAAAYALKKIGTLEVKKAVGIYEERIKFESKYMEDGWPTDEGFQVIGERYVNRELGDVQTKDQLEMTRYLIRRMRSLKYITGSVQKIKNAALGAKDAKKLAKRKVKA